MWLFWYQFYSMTGGHLSTYIFRIVLNLEGLPWLCTSPMGSAGFYVPLTLQLTIFYLNSDSQSLPLRIHATSVRLTALLWEQNLLQEQRAFSEWMGPMAQRCPAPLESLPASHKMTLEDAQPFISQLTLEWSNERIVWLTRRSTWFGLQRNPVRSYPFLISVVLSWSIISNGSIYLKISIYLKSLLFIHLVFTW